eukprot:10974718-Alexandrium_andersonii.AAC.1
MATWNRVCPSYSGFARRPSCSGMRAASPSASGIRRSREGSAPQHCSPARAAKRSPRRAQQGDLRPP